MVEGTSDVKESQVVYESEKDIKGVKYIRLIKKEDKSLINDGYKIKYHITNEKNQFISISAKNDNGILYGVFALSCLFEQNKRIEGIALIENPKKNIRIVGYWDNIDGTVERVMAGSSILFESVRTRIWGIKFSNLCKR